MTATVSYAPETEHRPSSPTFRMPTAVLDPQTTRVSAVWLMAAVSDPLRTSATGRLMEEAARLRTVTATDRAVEVVWDAEGGRETLGPTARPRIPAVTAPALTIPAVAPPTPNAAKGM